MTKFEINEPVLVEQVYQLVEGADEILADVCVMMLTRLIYVKGDLQECESERDHRDLRIGLRNTRESLDRFLKNFSQWAMTQKDDEQ